MFGDGNVDNLDINRAWSQMAEFRQLSRPPLREAIIDVRVTPDEALRQEGLNAARDLTAKAYPKVQEQWLFEGQVHLGEEAELAPESRKRFNGLIFRSDDETRAVQFRVDGFTFSRLAPYTDWEEVFPEAMQLWNFYIDVTKPRYVTRLATRYINAIGLALPLNLGEYFTAPPSIPPSVDLELAGFLTRTTNRDPRTDCWVHITQALEEVVIDERVTVVLDIDAFKNVHLTSFDEEEILDVFSQLREIKNKVFFKSISERMAGELE